MTTITGFVCEPCYGGYPVGRQMIFYSNVVGGFVVLNIPIERNTSFQNCQVTLWKCVNSRSACFQSRSLYNIEFCGIVNRVHFTVNLAFSVAANVVVRELNSHLPHTWLLTSSSLSRNVQSQSGSVQFLHVEFFHLI